MNLDWIFGQYYSIHNDILIIMKCHLQNVFLQWCFPSKITKSLFQKLDVSKSGFLKENLAVFRYHSGSILFCFSRHQKSYFSLYFAHKKKYWTPLRVIHGPSGWAKTKTLSWKFTWTNSFLLSRNLLTSSTYMQP